MWLKDSKKTKKKQKNKKQKTKNYSLKFKSMSSIILIKQLK